MGICTPMGQQFQCSCMPPFQGPTCADQDPCQPNPVIFLNQFLSISQYFFSVSKWWSMYGYG